MQKIVDNEFAIVEINKDQDFIKTTWKKFVNSSEFRATNNEIIKIIVSYQPKGYLSDIRNQGVVSPDDWTWITAELLPQVISAGVQKIAMVLDSDVFKQFYVDTIKTSVDATKKCELQHFSSEKAALEFIGAN